MKQSQQASDSLADQLADTQKQLSEAKDVRLGLVVDSAVYTHVTFAGTCW
jgi:hypothetical protein